MCVVVAMVTSPMLPWLPRAINVVAVGVAMCDVIFYQSRDIDSMQKNIGDLQQRLSEVNKRNGHVSKTS